MTVLVKSTVRPWASVNAAVVQDLEEDVEDVRVRLLHLVEEEEGVRVAADHLGELAGLLVADVAGRGADQAADRVPFLVLAHVEADHPLLAGEQGLGERAGQFGLADAGRAEEEEAADRPVRAGESGAGAQYRVGDHADRLVLADDPLVQMLLQAEQPVLLLLGQAAHRDAGLPGHHLGDRFRGDLQVLSLVGLSFPGVGDLPLQFADPVAQLRGRLVLLVRDRLVLVPGELLDLALQDPYVRALRPGAQPHPGARLVDQVDRLVRQPHGR